MAESSNSVQYKRIAKQQLRRLASGAIELSGGQIDTVSSEQPLQLILHYLDFSAQSGATSPSSINTSTTINDQAAEHAADHAPVWREQELALLMRTPGDDRALVLGFLYTQGIIEQLADIEALDFSEPNSVEIKLAATVVVDFEQLKRLFPSHSGCGICGQSQLKQLSLRHSAFDTHHRAWLPTDTVLQMPDSLKQAQQQFAATGGCHGVALFTQDAHDCGKDKGNDNGNSNVKLIAVAEDVGRHNALDKVIGHWLETDIALEQSVLVFSGRVSFELVQKAVVAGVPVILAIGAPSDLAVATAEQFNMTLVGFIKAGQANVYSDAGRLFAQTLIDHQSRADQKVAR